MCHRQHVRREILLLLALACPLGLTPTSFAGSPPPAQWLSWNARAQKATLLLVAGYNGANNGFNFDGYGRGKLLVRVPVGWRIAVTCRNAATVRHSCAIVRGPQTVTPAFRGATTPEPTLGLRSGQTARFTFTASRAGTYRIACLVPGHEEARMWDVLDVGGVRRPVDLDAKGLLARGLSLDAAHIQRDEVG